MKLAPDLDQMTQSRWSRFASFTSQVVSLTINTSSKSSGSRSIMKLMSKWIFRKRSLYYWLIGRLGLCTYIITPRSRMHFSRSVSGECSRALGFKGFWFFLYDTKHNVNRFTLNLHGLQTINGRKLPLIYYLLGCCSFWEISKTM